MTVKRKNIVANFEARSVALVASWTLAGAALAQTGANPVFEIAQPGADVVVGGTRLENQQGTRSSHASILGTNASPVGGPKKKARRQDGPKQETT